MKRRLLNLLTALSLLLFAGAAVLWVRSYRFTDTFFTPLCDLASDHGDVIIVTPSPEMVDYAARNGGTPPRWQWDSDARETVGPEAGFEAFKAREGRLGFVIGRRPYYFMYLDAVLPWWSVATLFGVLPFGRLGILASRRVAFHRRFRRSLCTACGYDLTANVSGVCPECGGPAR